MSAVALMVLYVSVRGSSSGDGNASDGSNDTQLSLSTIINGGPGMDDRPNFRARNSYTSYDTIRSEGAAAATPVGKTATKGGSEDEDGLVTESRKIVKSQQNPFFKLVKELEDKKYLVPATISLALGSGILMDRYQYVHDTAANPGIATLFAFLFMFVGLSILALQLYRGFEGNQRVKLVGVALMMAASVTATAGVGFSSLMGLGASCGVFFSISALLVIASLVLRFGKDGMPNIQDARKLLWSKNAWTALGVVSLISFSVMGAHKIRETVYDLTAEEGGNPAVGSGTILFLFLFGACGLSWICSIMFKHKPGKTSLWLVGGMHFCMIAGAALTTTAVYEMGTITGDFSSSFMANGGLLFVLAACCIMIPLVVWSSKYCPKLFGR